MSDGPVERPISRSTYPSFEEVKILEVQDSGD